MRASQSGKAAFCVLRAALAYCAGMGVQVREVLTDNGCAISREFRRACVVLGICGRRTRPLYAEHQRRG